MSSGGKQLLFSVILAAGIVAGGIWIADQSMKSRSVARVTTHQSSSAADAQTSQDAGPRPADATTSRATASPSSASSSAIFKCVVSGRVMYSNDACPDGVKQQAVALHDSAGIVSPPKENLADLTVQRKAAERAYVLQAQVTSLGRSGSAECEELDRRVTHLDAMARQPHSAAMQDWLGSERKAVRDRQFAIRC